MTDATNNPYQAKLAARADRLASRAASLRRAAESTFNRARSHIAGIEPGQPILVGHHSERRHRGDLARHDRAMRKAIELENAAKYSAERAAAVGTGGISADDPDAVMLLHRKVEKLQAIQARMKELNAIIRKHAKKGPEAQVAALIANGLSEARARDLIKPDFCGRIGFADYELTNNSANIRRIQQRIKGLERAMAREVGPERWSIGGTECDVIADKEENRLRLVFAGKPDDALRASLKRNGWKWSPSNNAWQRFLHTANLRWLRGAIGAEVVPS